MKMQCRKKALHFLWEDDMRWTREDYRGTAVETAKRLIGSVLVHETAEGILKGRITECEAYGGFYRGKPDDGAHSYKGLTARTKAIFGDGGHAYVYLIYGMYWCMNVVCGHEKEGYAVLLRGLEPLEGREIMQRKRGKAKGRLLTAGPGRLAMAMGIDSSLYGADLVTGNLYIEDGNEKVQVERSKRINIDYAKYGKNFPWRFTMKGSLWISK